MREIEIFPRVYYFIIYLRGSFYVFQKYDDFVFRIGPNEFWNLTETRFQVENIDAISLYNLKTDNFLPDRPTVFGTKGTLFTSTVSGVRPLIFFFEWPVVYARVTRAETLREWSKFKNKQADKIPYDNSLKSNVRSLRTYYYNIYHGQFTLLKKLEP